MRPETFGREIREGLKEDAVGHLNALMASGHTIYISLPLFKMICKPLGRVLSCLLYTRD